MAGTRIHVPQQLAWFRVDQILLDHSVSFRRQDIRSSESSRSIGAGQHVLVFHQLAYDAHTVAPVVNIVECRQLPVAQVNSALIQATISSRGQKRALRVFLSTPGACFILYTATAEKVIAVRIKEQRCRTGSTRLRLWGGSPDA